MAIRSRRRVPPWRLDVQPKPRWSHTYDKVAAWHNEGLPKPPGTPIEILARYLPKEKRWMVLVDGDEPFVTESASLAQAMEKAGTIIEAHS